MTKEELAEIEARSARCRSYRRPSPGTVAWSLTGATAMYACVQDVPGLIAEVRRLREQVKLHGGDPDVTLKIGTTIGHGEYVALQILEKA